MLWVKLKLLGAEIRTDLKPEKVAVLSKWSFVSRRITVKWQFTVKRQFTSVKWWFTVKQQFTSVKWQFTLVNQQFTAVKCLISGLQLSFS